MLVKIRVYDRVKYHAGAEKVAEACYEVERFEILNGEQINIESFGGDVDEHDEYLVLYLSNGESSTFRNSYVDLFIEHNEPNGTTDKEVNDMKNYKSEWLAACFGEALTPSKTVIAYFNNGHEPAEYGADLLPLLATDNTVQNIIDGYTGELIYTRR